jgi:Uma2 family endonuclease
MTTTTLAPTLPSAPSGWFNVADLLHDLGDIDASRVRMNPRPGTATIEDLIAANESKKESICECVDGTLVEKVMGFHESTLQNILIFEFELYLRNNHIGMTAGPDGVMRILPGIGRAPDITFIRWETLPGGKAPPRSDKVPAIVPDLVVEVLSDSNRPREVVRKREEYFRAGVKLVWEIDPGTYSAEVYRSLTDFDSVPHSGALEAGDLMPGFTVSMRELFARAHRRGT